MILRRSTPPPPDEPRVDPAARLARSLGIADRHDQAMAYVERALAANRGNTAVTDVLLDVRNLLRPPERPTT